MYIVVISCSPDFIIVCKNNLLHACVLFMVWAYNSPIAIPNFIEHGKREVITTRHKFWWIIENHVNKNGPFAPLKLFKHAAQSFYSKMKGGVDSARQHRAILRSGPSHFKWEQKIVSQTIKNVVFNSFISWRMFTRQDLLQSSQTLKSLDNYRMLLN